MKKKIRQYLDGTLPEKEQLEMLQWIRDENNRLIFESVKQNWWKEGEAIKQTPKVDIGKVRLNERLKEKQELHKSKLYLRIYKYAAVVLLIVGLGGFGIFFQNYLQPNFKYTEIRTSNGQVSNMTLPDGSTVWINAGTLLTYNNHFGIKNRDIHIKGEAYFSVKKDESVPFIVDMGMIRVKVTGTQFGVSNYENEKEMNVVLGEGAVNIHTSKNDFIAQLNPNQMAVFNTENHQFKKIEVKPEIYTSWKDGILNIFELSLEQLVFKLEKRYNQKFEVDPLVKDYPYTFSIEGESLSEVLYLIERISSVKAIQEGNIIKLKYMNH